MDSLLKPIGRRKYFIYSLALGLINMAIVGIGIGSMFMASRSEEMAKILPVILLFLLVKLVIDYKRIKDISPKQEYLLLLLIPIMHQIFGFMARTGTEPRYDSEQSPLFLAIAIFTGIQVLYSLFLLFKKGYPKNVAPTVSA